MAGMVVAAMVVMERAEFCGCWIRKLRGFTNLGDEAEAEYDD